MIATADIIARLKDRVPGTAFRTIAGAKDFLEAFQQTPASPAAFVLPAAERPGQNAVMTGVTRQRVAVLFTIVQAYARATAKGDAQLELAEAGREALKDALLGWLPPGASDPCTYAGWRMLALNVEKGEVYWGLDIASAYYERRSTE